MAIEQNRERKSSLAQFIANRGNKAVDKAIELAKELSQAESQSLHTKKTRIELLQEQTVSACAAGCRGRCLDAAEQLLQRYAIIKDDFCSAVYITFAKGRRKYRNIFIHGDMNCGKSVILSPLKVIYKTAKINISPTHVEIPLYKNINQDVIGSDINNKTQREFLSWPENVTLDITGKIRMMLLIPKTFCYPPFHCDFSRTPCSCPQNFSIFLHPT